jgi:hypothetical protein
MKVALGLILMASQPLLFGAALNWHEFGVRQGEPKVITAGKATITLMTRDMGERAFAEDHLILKAHVRGGRTIERWLDSSYGTGAVAVYESLLLVKYGIGRGTCVREEHVMVFRLTRDSLDELCDVQTSYYVSSLKPDATSPDFVEYQMKVTKSQGYTVLAFWTAQQRRGMPSEKKVMLRNG